MASFRSGLESQATLSCRKPCGPQAQHSSPKSSPQRPRGSLASPSTCLPSRLQSRPLTLQPQRLCLQLRPLLQPLKLTPPPDSPSGPLPGSWGPKWSPLDDGPDPSEAGAAEHGPHGPCFGSPGAGHGDVGTGKCWHPSTLYCLPCCVTSGEDVMNYYLPSRALCKN